MRPFLTLVIVLMFTALAAPTSHAQRDTIAPPVGGVYQAYYETEYPDRLEFFLLIENICLERFVTLNPDLDPEYIPYGTLITLPRNEPCYDYEAPYLTGTWWTYSAPSRMKYYENGQWLNEPYYSSNVTYVYTQSIQELVAFTNICEDILLRENYILAHYDIKFSGTLSTDVFLPQNIQPCNPNLSTFQPNFSPFISLKQRMIIPKHKLTPLELSRTYNICAEEVLPIQGINIYGSISQYTPDPVEIYIDQINRPCYNENGQRLRYFGDDGKRLERPEYTDLQVYVTQPGDTIQSITSHFGVCIVDFLSINNFPQLPLPTSIELFIPELRQCRENVFLSLLDPSSDMIDGGNSRDLPSISLTYNICVEDLSPINPHLQPRLSEPYLQRINYTVRTLPIPVLLPVSDIEPCYGEFVPTNQMSPYEIEKVLNVCQEAHIRVWSRNSIFYRLDSQPCYNEHGQRLRYIDTSHFTNNLSPYSNRLKAYLKDTGAVLSYSPLQVYVLQPNEYLIDISRNYNVCLGDLIETNPTLRYYFVSMSPSTIPIFIPDTPPCYDPITGAQLFYAENNVAVWPSTSLIHYGIETPTYLNHFYNVCINHIEDANRAKLDGETSYLGWIIPTDRPPCYTGNGSRINYACYAQNGLDAICFDDYSSDRFTLHTIGVGESLSSVAAQHGVEVWEITWANRLDMRQPLWPDQTLIIPKQSTSAQVYALVLGTFVSLLLVGGLIIPLARQTKNRD